MWAGAAGALAWELVLRALGWLGLPLFDMVRLLGSLAAPDGPPWAWWTAGLAMHGAVGALWAVFYEAATPPPPDARSAASSCAENSAVPSERLHLRHGRGVQLSDH